MRYFSLSIENYCSVNNDLVTKLACVNRLRRSTLSMDRHVANVAQSCFYHTRALRHIRPVLSLDCAKDIATFIVGTRLDYYNSLLFGTSQRNFDRLQRLQNNLARVVLQAPARASTTDSGVNYTGCRQRNVRSSR